MSTSPPLTASRARPAPPVDQPAGRMTLLAALLALAVLFHQQQLGSWSVPSLSLLLTVAAVWLLLRPQSVPRLALVLGLHVVTTVSDLPLVVNHWLLMLLAEVAILLALAVAAARRLPWVRDRGAVYQHVAPVLRVTFLLVYTLSAISKVNSDFLDTDLSCGVAMVDGLLTLGPVDLRTDLLDAPVVWGTIALELVLPVALVWRRTRLAALWVALGFHTVLALSGHVPFSGFALLYLSLFAPDDLLLRARVVLDRAPTLHRRTRATAASASGPLGAAAAALAVLALAAAKPALGGLWWYGWQLLFLLVTAAVAAALLACQRVQPGSASAYRPGGLRLASPAWLLLPLLVLINAASPYVGGKTQTTFTMYSNLQTEGPHWNSLVVPEAVQVFDTQDHLVRIVSSSDDTMQEAADTGTLWVWDGLRAWAQREPGAALVYEDAGRTYDVPRVGDDERLDMPALLARLAYYRDVPQGADNTCRTLRASSAEQHS
jgi:hypothetical protein